MPPPAAVKSMSSVPNRTVTPGVASATSRSTGSRVYCEIITGGSSGIVPSLTSSMVASTSAADGYRCRSSCRPSDPAQTTAPLRPRHAGRRRPDVDDLAADAELPKADRER
jgi:hypothetical protein